MHNLTVTSWLVRAVRLVLFHLRLQLSDYVNVLGGQWSDVMCLVILHKSRTPEKANYEPNVITWTSWNSAVKSYYTDI